MLDPAAALLLVKLFLEEQVGYLEAGLQGPGYRLDLCRLQLLPLIVNPIVNHCLLQAVLQVQ